MKQMRGELAAANKYANKYADSDTALHEQLVAAFLTGIEHKTQRDAELVALRENMADMRDATLFELQRAKRLGKEANELRELLKEVGSFFKEKMEG